jgi:hypothetical protein
MVDGLPMRLGLLVTRVGMIAFKLLIAIILFLAIFPLVTGSIMPDLSSIHWSSDIMGNDFVFQASIDVSNGGTFSIDDLSVDFQMHDQNGTLVASSASEPTSIAAGARTTIPIVITAHMDQMSQEMLGNLIFSNGSYGFHVGLQAKYPLRLVSLGVHFNTTMQMQPFISEVTVDTNAVRIETVGADRYLVLPYSFGASSALVGNQFTATMNASDADGQFSSASQTVTIATMNYGELRLPLTAAKADYLAANPDHITFNLHLAVRGASLDRNYAYDWPGGM